MEFKYLKFVVFTFLSIALATSQAQKKGYVGVNIDAEFRGGKNAYTVENEYPGNGQAGLEGTAFVDVPVKVHPQTALHSSLYLEKNVQPVKLEKQVEYKPAPVTDKPVEVEVVPQNVYVKKVYGRRHHPRREYTYIHTGDVAAAVPPPPRGGFLTKLLSVQTDAAAAVPVNNGEQKTTVVIATANVNRNGNLFDDIFNIPISTLQAVNQLVNNIASGKSISVTKQVSAVKTAEVSTHP